MLTVLIAVPTAVEQNAEASGSGIHANSATGSDTTGDGTSANPFRTFHKAYLTATSGSTINLSGTFTWTDADETGDTTGTGYSLSKNLTIVGQGRTSTIIQASDTRGLADRMVFFVAANTTVTFRDLTMQHGRVIAEGQGGGLTLAGQYCGNYPCASTTGAAILERVDVTKNDAPASGTVMRRSGGIYLREASTLTLREANVFDNSCTCYLYAAGGIAGGEQSQNVTISRSAIYDNVASSTAGSTWPLDYSSVAGGIAMQRFGQFKMADSTIFGNSTNHYAGGLNLYYQSRSSLTNVTIANNAASLGAGGFLWATAWSSDSTIMSLKNTLLANNTGASGAADDLHVKNSLAQSTLAVSHSIIEHFSNLSVSGTGVITGEQSQLGLASTLALNSSTLGTRTAAISLSSIAVDAGSPTAHGPSIALVTPTTTDQRGVTRTGSPDIGAFEAGANIPPTIASTSPADNATGVANNSSITLTFSEAVTAVTGKSILIKKTSDNSTVHTLSVTGPNVSVSGSVVTVNPTSNLAYSTGYYILVDAGAFKNVGDFNFAGISSSSTLNFTTGADTVAPLLSSVSPSDAATGVATAANLVFTFSENVVSVSGKQIVIKKSSNNAVVETISVTNGSRVSVSGNTVTVNPVDPFENGVSYYVLIDSGAFQDLAGNAYVRISTAVVVTFTVVQATTTTTASTSTTAPASNASPESSIPSSSTTQPSGSVVTASTVAPQNVLTRATSTTLALRSGSVVANGTAPTTTVAANEDLAPTAADAAPGSATALVDGKEVSLTVTRVANSLRISSGVLQMQIAVLNETGEVLPLDADGNAIVEQGLSIQYSVSGAEAGSVLDAWLFSEPFRLGNVVVGDNGKAEGVLPIKQDIPQGAHRLVLKTRSATGEDATFSIGLISGAQDGSGTVSRIIVGILLAAVAAGLVIPATRRRRRYQEMA